MVFGVLVELEIISVREKDLHISQGESDWVSSVIEQEIFVKQYAPNMFLLSHMFCTTGLASLK